MEEWPVWTENTVLTPLNIFEVKRDPRKISFCPEGESLNFNYNTLTN
jgi:hypothetical protein